MINAQESRGMTDDSSFHVYCKSLSVYFWEEVGGVQFEGLDPPKKPRNRSDWDCEITNKQPSPNRLQTTV